MLNHQASHPLAEWIDQAERITLIAHVNPDADAMGSACAMYAHLLRLHKKVTLFCASGHIDSRLACIPWSHVLTSRWDAGTDLAIAFDCGSYERLGVDPGCRLVNVDHHGGNEGYGDLTLLDAEAVSTTAVLYGWFRAEQIRINAKMATALYAGMADDTRGFMSRRTDASALEMAAELARAGAQLSAVNSALFLQKPLSALRLKGMMLQQLSLRCDGRIAVLKVSREMFEQSGADSEVCESVLHEVQGLPTVKVALLLRERRDGSVKGSLRSDDGTDVRNIALHYGGGGHRYAAGFIAEGVPMEPLGEALITLIEKEWE